MKKVFAVIAILGMFACQEKMEKKISFEDDVAFLASDDLAGRETGTEGEIKAAHYIKDRFKSMELQAMGNAGTYFQTFTFAPKNDPHGEVRFRESGKNDSLITGTNVIGFLNHKAKNTIVIGAHYDHLGMGGEGSLHREGAAIHNGADDNASGVAIMLQLAETLKAENYKGNNYLFIAFSGEEMGLLGSNFFTKNATIDLSTVNYMINMDMVGRLNDDKALAVHGTGTSPIFPQAVFSANSDFKIAEHKSGVGPSDHTSFYLNDIPVLHFFTGQHEDYHKPGDDSQKLNYDGMALIQKYIEAIILELDDNGKIKFTKTKDESAAVPSFKVGLGVVPDYLYSGSGMRIDGVSEGKAAQNAKLQRGDIVIKMGDSTVTDMMSYMRVLSTFDQGDTTTVVIQREGEEIEKEVTFVKD
ncbi:M20/M25/M40 family metallo-hydrolase [Dokdonia sinensis]|uniref:M20/M25/M40 family metallo-hydrolase n=1 Tax=Dokdonia sinensis TaxID=2479847 RepID=A0A3M0H031_9FLAO|nr:M20/M25/M40 family metallo-hydrolase [Dokdonia sinensis]RMB62946.1 M20/M25/M40 family metallo-hydrolase [Dokdonia sinensis]